MLGRLQRDGDDAAARFAASLVEVRLLAQGRGWQSGSGPRVILACAPREEYVLDLIAFGLVLADRRCRIVYLGASTPTTVLRTATRDGDAAALVLSAETLDLQPREIMQLRLVGRDAPTFTVGVAADELAGALLRPRPARRHDPGRHRGGRRDRTLTRGERRHVIPPEGEAGPAEMPLSYEIRVRGRVEDELASALGMNAQVEPVETVLRGAIGEQEDLHEILARLQDLGLELLEIRRLPAEP